MKVANADSKFYRFCSRPTADMEPGQQKWPVTQPDPEAIDP